MPNIEFPNIPAYSGVPSIVRSPFSAIATNAPTLAIGLGVLDGILSSSLQQPVKWGIFDALGNQLGIDSSVATIITSATSQFTGIEAPTISTVGFEYAKETRISDFPVEGGSFANYNKVEAPGTPVIQLCLSGGQSDRSAFLSAMDGACKSTDLYSVVTPEVTYVGYSIERYNYQRKGNGGAGMLTLEVFLQEVRQVSAAFSVVSPIAKPQLPSATPSVDSGKVQAKALDQSTLKSMAGKFGF